MTDHIRQQARPYGFGDLLAAAREAVDWQFDGEAVRLHVLLDCFEDRYLMHGLAAAVEWLTTVAAAEDNASAHDVLRDLAIAAGEEQ